MVLKKELIYYERNLKKSKLCELRKNSFLFQIASLFNIRYNLLYKFLKQIKFCIEMFSPQKLVFTVNKILFLH